MLATDSSLYMWGNNDFGQLGDGTTTQQNRPGGPVFQISAPIRSPHHVNCAPLILWWAWNTQIENIISSNQNLVLSPLNRDDFSDSHFLTANTGEEKVRYQTRVEKLVFGIFCLTPLHFFPGSCSWPKLNRSSEKFIVNTYTYSIHI